MRIKLNNKCEQQSEGPKSEKQNHYQMQGQECDRDKGKIVNEWSTGDDECNAYSVKYECGGIYNNNYGDVVGNRDHDCFWNCSNCKYKNN